MGYLVQCSDCNEKGTVWHQEIVVLRKHYEEHPTEYWNSLFKCKNDPSHFAHIALESRTQDNKTWKRNIRGVVWLQSDSSADYQPYVWLVNGSKGVERPDKLEAHFGYYRDFRKEGGRLKHGHGPGGPPVVDQEQLKALLGIINRINSGQL